MSGDYSRRRFDPHKHYTSVLMQQGRVQLDADWNEMAELFERRFRAERVDTFGRAAVPRTGPGQAGNARAFELTIRTGKLHLGRGRIYVDGLLAENHGPAESTRILDPVLDELHGDDDLPFAAQPYYSGAPLPPADRPFLVYLDVWRREVTSLEDPDLVEPAVGVDTTTRVQTAWQARIFTHPSLKPTSTAQDIEALPEWQALVRPSGARLTVTTGAPDQGEVDPCILPPGGGFRSLANQLYRLEIHRGGAQPTTADEVGRTDRPTFKWSRDNASVASAVLAVRDDILVLDTLGRDAVLRFREGDWVELTDDLLEAQRLPGVMARIVRTDDDERTIQLHAPLAKLLAARPDIAGLAAAFPDLAPARHLRVRRWDQAGKIVDDQGAVLVDLADPASGGVIPLPEPGRFVVLESGIKIAFSSEGGEFRVADHWTFAARAHDGSVEPLDRAPPHGDHHHFALLGLVTLAPPVVSDLRTLWPPQAAGGGCRSTIHVGVDEHNSGQRTIQSALAELRTSGGTVCLDAGVYRLVDDALRIDGARNVTLRGQGKSTVLVRQYRPGGPDPTFHELVVRLDNGESIPDEDKLLTAGGKHAVLVVSNSLGFALEDLTLLGGEDGYLARYQCCLANCVGIRVERCAFVLKSGPPDTMKQGDKEVDGPQAHAALVLHGVVAGATIRDNVFLARLGLASLRLMSADLRIEGNLFQTSWVGMAMFGWVATQSARIENNRFIGADGLAFDGTASGTAIEVRGNHFEVRGAAIRAQANDITIADNTILGDQLRPGALPGAPPATSHPTAVEVRESDLALPVARARIEHNHIRHVHTAIRVDARCEHLRIAGNHLADLGGRGVVVEASGGCDDVLIEGNRLDDIAGDAPTLDVRGISVRDAMSVRIAGNVIDRIGAASGPWPEGQLSYVRAIAVENCIEANIHGNEIRDCGPAGADGQVAVFAVFVQGFHGHLDVGDNLVTRRSFRGAHQSQIPLFVLHTARTGEADITRVPSPAGGMTALFFDRAVPLSAPAIAVIGDNHISALWSSTSVPRLPELMGDGAPGPAMPVVVHTETPLRFSANRIVLLTPQADRRDLGVLAELSSPQLTSTFNHWTHAGGLAGDVGPLVSLFYRSLIAFGETYSGLGVATAFIGPPVSRDSNQTLVEPYAFNEPFT